MNQACSIVASISTCTCLYSRITVEIMLKSLWVGFHLCFLFSGFVSSPIQQHLIIKVYKSVAFLKQSIAICSFAWFMEWESYNRRWSNLSAGILSHLQTVNSKSLLCVMYKNCRHRYITDYNFCLPCSEFSI